MGCLYYNLFKHSLIEGHLGSFRLLKMKPLRHLYLNFCVKTSIHFSAVYAQECNCEVCWCKSIVSFKRKCQTVFQSRSTILHSHLWSHFSTSPPSFGVITVLLFLIILSDIMISYCSLNLHFSNDLCCTPFHVLIFHLYMLFCAMSVHTFWPFLSQIVCFSIVKFWEFFIYSRCKFFVEYVTVNTLFWSMVYLIILLTASFSEQVLILIKSNLSAFFYVLWL